MNLSTFLLRRLKAEQCDFWGENCSGAGAFSKQGFLPCPSIIRNSKRRTQNPSKSLEKTAFGTKGRRYTTVKVIQRSSNIDLYTYLAIYRYRESKKWLHTHTLCGPTVCKQVLGVSKFRNPPHLLASFLYQLSLCLSQNFLGMTI